MPTCGAAQEKQSAAALPSSTPPALPWCFVWGFLAAGHKGHHPENWLSGNPLYSTAFVEVGTSAVATAQTPQPGNVGPLDDLVGGSLHRARSALASQVLSRACSRSSLYPARPRKLQSLRFCSLSRPNISSSSVSWCAQTFQLCPPEYLDNRCC